MKPFLKILQLGAGSILAAGLLSGCIFLPDKQLYVSIAYNPQTGVSPIAGAGEGKVKVEMIDSRSTVYKVSDYDAFPSTVTGILTATNNTASDAVRSAIETELASRGFSLAGGNVVVVVELSRFYNTFKSGVWSGTAVAQLNMNVQVKRADGNIVFTKLVAAEGITPHIQRQSEKNAKIALDAALQDAMAKLFSDGTFADALLKAGKP